jgi:hypothetical protein
VSTHTSSWITWELETAIEMEKPIIAMAMKEVNSATLPALIRNKGVPFCYWNPFKLETHLGTVVVE